MEIPSELRDQLLRYQQNEITEHHIYARLAKVLPSAENRRILEKISQDELRHYRQWKRHTGQDVAPNRWEIFKYYWISRLFGFTFGVKLMEGGEEDAQKSYALLQATIPEAEQIIREEQEHEQMLIDLLDEDLLRYVGSIVLGLNDALVELTGALAGLTLALQDTKLIALTGSITGIAAALSMGASEYLSTKTEEVSVDGEMVKSPLRASVYTGVAYIITVVLLILPYLVLQNFYLCLGVTLATAVLIIAVFNYYISVAKDIPFRGRFLEMAGLSLGVAALSFLVGFLLRTVWGIEV